MIPIEIRFWSQVRVNEKDKCWFWTGNKDFHGYGVFWVNGKRTKAHRVAWALWHKQDFPADKLACHTCDNPGCVNPLHIWPGTMSENIKDARSKGRIVMPHERPGYRAPGKDKTHCKRGHPLSGDNLYITTKGARSCRECGQESRRKWYNKKREEKSSTKDSK